MPVVILAEQVCVRLSDRNSDNNGYPYPYEYFRNVIRNSVQASSEAIFIILDGIDSPEFCKEAARYLACMVANYPCDIENDLPLDICKDSCTAYNALMATTLCGGLRDEIQEISDLLGFAAYSSVYLEFDCNDPSTYYFLDDENVTFYNGSCTNLFSAESQGKFVQWIAALTISYGPSHNYLSVT